MLNTLSSLREGLLLAIVVILLVLSANFQSVRAALVIVSTMPAVLAGVALTLWLTGTTLNIQSFMGAIMAVGVAVANAILLVTFAERSRIAGALADAAAVEGARSRLRPLLYVLTDVAPEAARELVAAGAHGILLRSLPLAAPPLPVVLSCSAR